jgi:hypothetical protein
MAQMISLPKSLAWIPLLATCIMIVSYSGGGNSSTRQSSSRETQGTPIRVADVFLRAPVGWLEADSATLATVREFAVKDSGVSALSPQFVFKREGGGPMLLVSTFSRSVELGNNFVPWAGEIARLYRAQRPTLKIEEQWLNYGDFDALVLRSKSERVIHHKVILRAASPVSLDYSVPAHEWTNEASAVEASLASIQRVSN